MKLHTKFQISCLINNFDNYFRSERCSCTALDTFEGDIATVGEDENVNILSGRRGDITQSISDKDSCSIHSVCFLKLNEV